MSELLAHGADRVSMERIKTAKNTTFHPPMSKKSEPVQTYSDYTHSQWYVYWDSELYPTHAKEYQVAVIFHLQASEPAFVNYDRITYMTRAQDLFTDRSGLPDEAFDELKFILTRFMVDMNRRYAATPENV